MPLSAFSAFGVLVFLVRFGAFLSVFVLFSAFGVLVFLVRFGAFA